MTVTDYKANTERARDPKRARRTIWMLWGVPLIMILALLAMELRGGVLPCPWWLFTPVPLLLLARISWLLYSTRPSKHSTDAAL